MPSGPDAHSSQAVSDANDVRESESIRRPVETFDAGWSGQPVKRSFAAGHGQTAAARRLFPAILILSLVLVALLEYAAHGEPSVTDANSSTGAKQQVGSAIACDGPCLPSDSLMYVIKTGRTGNLPADPELVNAITLAQTIDSQVQAVLSYVIPMEASLANGGGWLVRPATVSDVQKRAQFEQVANGLVQTIQPTQLGPSSTQPPACLNSIYERWLNGRFGLFFGVVRETAELDYGVQQSFQSVRQLGDLANGVEASLAAVRVSDCTGSTAQRPGTSVSSRLPSPAVAERATQPPIGTGGSGGVASTSAPTPLPAVSAQTRATAIATVAAQFPPATPLSHPLSQLALSISDVPAGLVMTTSGPSSTDMGDGVVASYQEQYQRHDVAAIQDLQQTLVIINLLGQYRDTASAAASIHAINQWTLNQFLGGTNITAIPTEIPAIGDDSQAFHFTGSMNGAAVGGYLIAFHSGSIASLILAASVQGSESLPTTIALARTQLDRLQRAP